MTAELSFRPLKRNLWTDFEELFGPNGACAGCWCMFWKLRGKAYEEARSYETRQMHKSIVDSGVVTGLLAYLHGEVVGWIAVELRDNYPKLAHSRALKPVDDEPVWSVTCFFVAKKSRRMRITIELLKAAVEHVKKQGGKIVEGYPVDAQKDMPAPFIYTGTVSAFQQAGFQEVGRRSPMRPIFRFVIE
jgi:GNAT superfamily N-acetyltransferase